jgi:hypothetical protein
MRKTWTVDNVPFEVLEQVSIRSLDEWLHNTNAPPDCKTFDEVCAITNIQEMQTSQQQLLVITVAQALMELAASTETAMVLAGLRFQS